MITDKRTEAFDGAVAELQVKGARTGPSGAARIVGVLLMVVGVVVALIAYNVSLTQDDTRDLASSQILALIGVALTVAGGALYVVGALARLLSLWLLRQSVDARATGDRIAAALERR